MKVALIQTNAGADKKKNVERALSFAQEAARKKAQFIVLPETFNYRGRPHPQKGYRPVAVSAESITASVPSKMALATSETSARVGVESSTIDSSI